MRTTARELWRRLRRIVVPAGTVIHEPAPARTVHIVLRPPDGDDFRDALALIQCAHDHDELGALTILRYGKPGAVAIALSIVAHGLLGELCEAHGGDHDTAMARWRSWAQDDG